MIASPTQLTGFCRAPIESSPNSRCARYWGEFEPEATRFPVVDDHFLKFHPVRGRDKHGNGVRESLAGVNLIKKAPSNVEPFLSSVKECVDDE